MIFKRIKIKNFLSLGEVDVSLDDRGIQLIMGQNKDDDTYSSNGAGKSSILEALFWVLFNVTLRGIRGSDVVRRGSNLCEVSLEGEINGERFLVVRSRGKSSPKLVLEYKNKTYEKETAQSFIDEFIGDKEIFRTIITVDTSFMSLTEPARREWIERSLGVEWIDKSHDVAKEEYSKCKTKLATFQAKKEVLASELARAKDAVVKFDNETSKTELENKIYECGKDKVIIETTLKTIQEDINKTLQEKQGLESNKEKLLALQAAPREKEELHLTNVTRIEEELKQSKKEKTSLDLELQRAKSLDVLAKCPVCKRPVSEDCKENIVKELEERINSINVKIQTNTKQLGIAKESLEKFTAARKKCEEDVDTNSQETRVKQELIESLNRQKLEEEHKLQVVTLKIENYQKELNTIEDAREKLQDEVIRLQSEIGECDTVINESSWKIKELQVWVDAFGKDIRIFLIKTAIVQLNKFLKQVSHWLLGDTLTAKFSVEDKRKTVTRSAFTIELNKPYASLSTGERKRVDLAVLFALFLYARQQKSINCIFLDEVFDGLDGIGIEGVVETLRRVESLGSVGTIFVITHNDTLTDRFDNTIVIEKKEGVSEIVSCS